MPVCEFRDKLAAATVARGFSAAGMLAVAALFGSFIGVVLWFDGVDFYHRHFFDAGAMVAADNLLRLVFLGIFSWLIYAPGAAVVGLLMVPGDRAALTAAERGVLGFGIGIGIWYVATLILGQLDLYYRWVAVVLCLAVLIGSAKYFARVAVAGCRAFAGHVAELRRGRAPPSSIGAIVAAVVAFWLILRCGLFPGGGTDYYTHYFYYYLEVLKNHGLAPNDVWYQYYYSKGSGLAFLGMLLTDPEAPALTGSAAVLGAVIAIATMARRLVPGSLWPAAGVLVYLLFYLVGLNPGIAEGDFQKDHEAASALVVLFAWALGMERCGPARPFRVMAAAVGIATAVLSPLVAILLGLFAGLLAGWAVLRRRWGDMWGYGSIAAAIAAVVLAAMTLSYLATGLPNDQPLDLMLHFADVSRLDRWGVIPQVIAVAWIRHNYQDLVPPLGWQTVKQLVKFTRLGALWPFLAAPIITAVALRVADALSGGRPATPPREPSAASFAGATAARLAALLGFLVIVALAAGRAQNISFERLSTFFVPLIALFGIAGSACVLARHAEYRRNPWFSSALPLVLLVSVVFEWQVLQHWTRRLPAETANALRFFAGRISLAEAYAHADSGYAFGAINPGALAAARQLPYGTPIWSTNVDSYCMVPGCLIESVLSFKMSGRLEEILGGEPELARQRLQEAGLNYFLFMKDSRLIDLLPFSRLFAPDAIGRYLGIKWSDGSTFLLTWIGPDTKPIGPDFLEPYVRRRTEPDPLQWFKFDKLATQIVLLTPKLRQVTQWGGANKLLIWP